MNDAWRESETRRDGETRRVTHRFVRAEGCEGTATPFDRSVRGGGERERSILIRSRGAMIKAFIVVNNHAMVRLCRFYEQLGVDKQTELCQTVYKLVSARPDHLCSFVDDEKTFGPDTKLVYRHFATLYFCILSDRSESELAMLDLIQVYVETLDRVFENVCELDLIFNSPKAYTVLDETIVGGLVLEINTNKILNVYDQLMKLEKMHSSLMDKIAIS